LVFIDDNEDVSAATAALLVSDDGLLESNNLVQLRNF
jgi:hypothetical protein